MGSGVHLVTAQTPVFAIKYPVVGEPIRTTRQILQDNATAIEAALLSRSATPPGASDLTALAARVTSLEVDPVILQDAGSAATMTTGGARVSLSPARLVNPLTLFGRAGVGAVCHVQYRALVNTATAGSGSFVDAFLRTAAANPTTGVPGGYTDVAQDSEWMVTRGTIKLTDTFLVPAGTALSVYAEGQVGSGVTSSTVAGTATPLWNRLRILATPYIG